MADQLSQLLLKAWVASGEVDSWIWKEGGFQTFSVNSAYNLVRKDLEANSSPIFVSCGGARQCPLHCF